MNYEYLILILIGVAICIFPKYFREYRTSQWGKELPPSFIKVQRITGMFFIILGIFLIVLDL